MDLLPGLKATLGEPLMDKIQACKILLVGSGGIGCELLKNLALTGFRSVEVIDLDTIDVSNLNRQLLFRSQHVGMPKCTVACEVATEMAKKSGDDGVTYEAHHGNVCDNSKFNVQFVQGFDVVLNALDNVVARRRVNRLCLAANVPLVEAGTTGYLGQVNVIDKASNVACYECKTQEMQKVYPICTIRSTPSMPVHTIVWAKECYKLLFGEKAEESMLYEDPNAEEPSTFMQAAEDYRAALKESKGSVELAKALMEKIYVTEIQKQLDMERYKTAQKIPQPLAAKILDEGCVLEAPTRRESYRATDIWQPVDCVAEFVHCLETADPATALPSFDKDDTMSMNFVTAAANLRAFVFGIEPLQSFYTAKGIAGNIIPASTLVSCLCYALYRWPCPMSHLVVFLPVATTNAIAAGLQILQLFRILQCQVEKGSKTGHLMECCSYVNIIRNTTRNGLCLTASKLEPPNPHCYVCKKAALSLSLNVEQWTLEDLLSKIIKKDMGFEEPSLMLGNDLIWEEGEDADTAVYQTNLSKRLKDLPCEGIGHGTTLLIEDFSQDLTVDVTFSHQTVWEGARGEEVSDEDYKFVLSGAVTKAKNENGESAANGTAAVAPSDDDDDDVVLLTNQPKKRAAESNGEGAAKKARVEIPGELEVIDDV
jgi:ubiquitin-like 1-activating enzyme E1 B